MLNPESVKVVKNEIEIMRNEVKEGFRRTRVINSTTIQATNQGVNGYGGKVFYYYISVKDDEGKVTWSNSSSRLNEILSWYSKRIKTLNSKNQIH
ncbi:MAG: hypothetical protein KG003_08015 [Bacteroidetes bacterium]|nr:hypothetical protein [Bacteroidota bacterium]